MEDFKKLGNALRASLQIHVDTWIEIEETQYEREFKFKPNLMEANICPINDQILDKEWEIDRGHSWDPNHQESYNIIFGFNHEELGELLLYKEVSFSKNGEQQTHYEVRPDDHIYSNEKDLPKSASRTIGELIEKEEENHGEGFVGFIIFEFGKDRNESEWYQDTTIYLL